MYHFSFQTTGLNDSRDDPLHDTGGVKGQSLAEWLSEQLKAHRFEVSEIWREGRAWNFWTSNGSMRYLCACSIRSDPHAAHEGHVTLNKQQTFWQWLTGRRKYTRHDAVLAAVRAALLGNAGVEAVVEEG